MVEVALVGIGCRFPGGIEDAPSFWEFMLNKGDGIVDIPADRWNADRFYDPDPDAPGRMYTRRGGFLTHSIWDFDPEFFGMSPREAAVTDPQQRLLLEVAWEALDDAGHAGRTAGRPIGVYIGGFTNDSAGLRTSPTQRPFVNSHSATSSSHTLLSNRISYALDLIGPSMTIDTACSSSLVALHEAVSALERGECEMALVGGANTMLRPETFISMCKGRFLAFDGRSKSFDASADGYGRGEGAGVVLVRPLADAIRDGDRIYSVIRGTGVNQDGRTIAIPVPNPVSQRDLAVRVCAEAGIDPADVAYVEAHGTGTSVGDPLELEALGGAYGAVAGRSTDLVVGSIKASIGHTEAAAGIASVIKSALSIHHGTIVPQAWLDTLNPAIPFDALRIRIPVETEPFPEQYSRRLVAINGFGYGGTNAHVVMQEAPAAPLAAGTDTAPSTGALPLLFPISARTDAAARIVAANAANAARALDSTDTDSSTDLACFTAAAWTRRAHHPVRAALPYTDAEDLVRALDTFAAGEGTTSHVVAGDTRPVFVFSGMGPQWWGMARELLLAGGEFARTAGIVDDAFIEIASWSIIEELLRDEDSSRVTRTDVAQPANFLVQVALVAELATVGVTASTVVGHSVGEVSAAYVSGALSLHDALLVSYHRARLQATTAGTGSMLAVGLSAADAEQFVATAELTAAVSVAAVNSPTAVTLAGDTNALLVLADQLTDAGIFARALQVEVPYHSYLMDPILGDVADVLASLDPQVPALELYSTVTTQQVTGALWDAAYWCANVRQPVRFADTVSTLVAAGHRVFLEVGPHPVLTGNIREILIRAGEPGTSIGTLVRKEPDSHSLSIALSALYGTGAYDGAVYAGSAGATASPHIDLPAYPWQRTTLWSEDEATAADRFGSATDYPMLGDRIGNTSWVWQVELAASPLPWLPDHVVDGLVVLPGAGYLDAVLSAAAVRTSRTEVGAEDVEFVAPLVVDEHDVPVVQVTVEESTRKFVVRSRSAVETRWTVHATGRLVEGRFDAPFVASDLTEPVHEITGDVLYPLLHAAGLHYGPSFRRIIEARIGTDIVVATIDGSVPPSAKPHLIHPAVLDTALQCVATLGFGTSSGAVVPASVGAVRRYGRVPDRATVVVHRTCNDPLRTTIAITDDEGKAAITLTDVVFRPIAPPQPLHADIAKVFYEPAWELRENRGHEFAAEDAARDFALVVLLGDAADDSAAADRARTIATSRVNSTVVHATSFTSGELADLLRIGLSTEGVDRATVVAVAGNLTDPAAAVHSLLTAARTVHTAIYGDEAGPAFAAGSVTAVVVTERAFCMPGDTGGADLTHSGLVGARRSLRNEQSPAAWRLIDVEKATTDAELVAETITTGPHAADDADEVALRQGSRWVVVLKSTFDDHLAIRSVAAPLTDPERSFTVEVPKSKLVSDLAFREHARRTPGPREIEVRMEAIGLNYKDPLKVMGVLTEKELTGTYFGTTLGLEGSGVVTRVGPGVTEMVPGDHVGVCARDMMQRYFTLGLDDGATMVIPSEWDLEHCSSILPYMCAHFGLVHLARVQPGDTVLVHGAAGGMGLAAVKVAKLFGARVIATAGTEERRAVATEAGADEVLASRSLNYSQDVLTLTDGRGVDIVFNSSPGEIIAQNLHVAAEFARIIDIGKADIYSGGVLDLKPFDRNLSFFAVDMDRMFEHKTALARQVTQEVLGELKAGRYTHLPYTVYPLSLVGDAFDAVVRSTHTGRVVLSLNETAPLVLPETPTITIDPAAAYLVTGGFGAFGTAIARWLVNRGARKLVLLGRSGANSDRARADLAAFESAGVQVTQELVDISDYDDLAQVLARITASGTTLGGVFHTAGVVDNLAVNDITEESLQNIFAPKVTGAQNLDRALDEADIDPPIFVLFSSMSSLSGGAPQVSYSAANSVLDALAWSRRGRGKAALTVSWGAMGGGGMAQEKAEVVRYLDMLGFRNIDMDAAALYLEECLTLDLPHIALVGIDWEQWGVANPASARIPRFSSHVAAASTGGTGISALHAEILALPQDQRADVLTFILAEQLATVMGVDAEAVDVQTPLPELGLDSLMAVEFAARVGKSVGLELSVLEFGRGHGLASIGARLAADLSARAQSDAVAAPAPVPVSAGVSGTAEGISS